MKAPPRRGWPPAGAQIRLTRADGNGAGLRRFCAFVGDSLLTSGVNSDQVSFTPLREIERVETIQQDGRPCTVWGG